MANCDDILEQLKQLTYAVAAVAREFNCFNQKYGQSNLGSEWLATHLANMEQFNLHSTREITRAIYTTGQAIAKIDVPAPDPRTFLRSDPAENPPLGCVDLGPDWYGMLTPPEGGGGGT